MLGIGQSWEEGGTRPVIVCAMLVAGEHKSVTSFESRNEESRCWYALLGLPDVNLVPPLLFLGDTNEI